MERYDVFKSEGGYRLCLATWGGNPIIDQSPWYKSETEAIEAGRKHRIKAKCYDLVEEKLITLSPDFLGKHTEGTDHEIYISHIWHLANKKKPTKKDFLEMERYINEKIDGLAGQT